LAASLEDSANLLRSLLRHHLGGDYWKARAIAAECCLIGAGKS
jgi:hypothetical protein